MNVDAGIGEVIDVRVGDRRAIAELGWSRGEGGLDEPGDVLPYPDFVPSQSPTFVTVDVSSTIPPPWISIRVMYEMSALSIRLPSRGSVRL